MLEQYPDIMTVDDLREALMIGHNQSYKLLNFGKLGAFKIGAVWKIPKIGVQEYIISQSGIRNAPNDPWKGAS